MISLSNTENTKNHLLPCKIKHLSRSTTLQALKIQKPNILPTENAITH